MKYQQLTYEERIQLATLRKQGLSVRAIAVIMKRHVSTLYREFNRNRCNGVDTCYRPSRAQWCTVARRRRSRRNYHYTQNDSMLVRQLLRQQWSPQQIVGHIKRFSLLDRCMSHETIYRYIWRDKAMGGGLWLHLRQSQKQRRKRYKAYDSRGRLANKRHISQRPASVGTKKYKGHWEIDTVHGRGTTDCIVTLLERKTDYVMIGKLEDKSTTSLNKKTIRLIKREEANVKTITADNGTEFHQYKKLRNNVEPNFILLIHTTHGNEERMKMLTD